MRILTVLRSGGDFMCGHARALAAQIQRHAFPYELEVLSDVNVPGVWRIPLKHNWPGWWSKMELFAQRAEDILYLDLDTVITAGLEAITSVNRLTMLRDPYHEMRQRPWAIGSGMMFLPEADRAEVWAKWIANPAQHMRDYPKGDQQFLESIWRDKAARWQDLLPGQIVSYKVDVRRKKLAKDARVVIFHGIPRPWNTPEFEHLYRGEAA